MLHKNLYFKLRMNHKQFRNGQFGLCINIHFLCIIFISILISAPRHTFVKREIYIYYSFIVQSVNSTVSTLPEQLAAFYRYFFYVKSVSHHVILQNSCPDEETTFLATNKICELIACIVGDELILQNSCPDSKNM